jgi:hypothetical protein
LALDQVATTFENLVAILYAPEARADAVLLRRPPTVSTCKSRLPVSAEARH